MGRSTFRPTPSAALFLLGGSHLRRSRPFLAALALLVLSALPAQASWMVPGVPYRPKDFTIVKHDGLYHLFYIRHNMNLANDATETDLGHAMSADLWTWEQAPPVLAVRDSSWDRTHVWAPSIVEKDGVFHMLYTGVTTIPGECSGWQRIGLATSTDLLEWQRLDQPVHACTAVPWTVCDSTVSTAAFRDPFVMPDPASPGHWLMYYSTFPASDSGGMVAGMAASDGDLASWSDLGPLWITNRSYSYESCVESAHLFDHDGLWYLFFTTNAGQPLAFATGPDPVGAPGTWTYRGQLSTMLGVDTSPWFASEHFRDGLVDYFAFVLGDRIEIRRMLWGVPGTFALAQPSFMHVRRMAWGRDSTMQDSTETLTIVAVNWATAKVHLEALRVLADGSRVPVSLDSLGLPATVTLTGDTTRVSWSAAWLPDPADTTRDLRLVLRLTDQTAAAPELTIARRPTLEVTSLAWEGGEVAEGDTARLAIVTRNGPGRSVGLTTLRLRSDSTLVALAADSLGFPDTVALSGDTTWVVWPAVWLPDEPDTARLLRLVVRTADSSAVAEPLVVVGPERPLYVLGMGWESGEVAQGDTARLAIVARNWPGRSVELAVARLRGDSTLVALAADSLGFPPTVALTGDTTRVVWASVWLPDEPDTARLLRLVVRTADSSAVAEPLTVIGPERPLRVLALVWDRDSVVRGKTATLRIVAQNWAEHSVDLRALRRKLDRSLVPISLDSLGLPGTVALTAETTRLMWRAVWYPDEPDTVRPMALFVLLQDSSVVSPRLDVYGPPWPPDSLVAVPDPGTPAALRLESVYPTPSLGTLWVSFALPGDAPASLELMDVAGRRVWRQEIGPSAAGRHVARLGDGALPGGIYFVRLSQSGRHLVARAVVLR